MANDRAVPRSMMPVTAAIVAQALLMFGSTANRAYNVLAHIVWMLDDDAWVFLSFEHVALALDLSEDDVEAAFCALVRCGALTVRVTSGDPLYRLNPAYLMARIRRLAACN